MPGLGIFRLQFEDNIVRYEIGTLQFVYLLNFPEKQQCLDLGPDMPYWVFLTKKYLLWKKLGWNFRKKLLNLSICKILQTFARKSIPKFCLWNAYFGCFRNWIWKQYCHIWNQHPRIRLIVKFWLKRIAYLWQKMLDLVVFV